MDESRYSLNTCPDGALEENVVFITEGKGDKIGAACEQGITFSDQNPAVATTPKQLVHADSL